MQIIAYGIPWSVKLRDEEGNVSIKHGGSGITFVGKPYVHPFWGPYIDAGWVYIKDESYYMIRNQWFIAPELEQLSDYRMLDLYRTEIDIYKTSQSKCTFSKSAFKDSYEFDDEEFIMPNEPEWKMPLKTIFDKIKKYTNYTIKTIEDATYNMLQRANHYPFVYVDYTSVRPYLYAKDEIHDNLPGVWTLNDLYEAHKQYYDSVRKARELLWYDIAAKVDKETIKLVTIDYSVFGKLATLCVEQPLSYGITTSVVIPRKTTYLSEERVR